MNLSSQRLTERVWPRGDLAGALAVLLPLLTVGAVEFAFATPCAAAKPKKATSVDVQSTTEGALVFVDGRQVGLVPLANAIPLTPGQHTIKVSKPGFADYLDQFTLRAGQSKTINVDLSARAAILRIDGSPLGAIVAIGQKQIGEIPYEGEVLAGAEVLEVRAKGYTSHKQPVELVLGELSAIEVRLVPLPEGSITAADATWYGQWWVWAGAAAVVAGGVTAAILLSQPEPEPPPKNPLEIDLVR